MSGADPASRRLLALVAALAVVHKLAYFLEYTRLPFLDGPIFDSVVYLRQSRAILQGDFGHPTLLAFSPLYGWFLAALGGEGSPVLPVVAQMALGGANLVLLYGLAGRQWGRSAGAAAALLYLGYGLTAFYETKILSETLGLSLTLVALVIFSSPGFREGRSRHALGAGAVLALAVLARASLVFAAPLFVVAAALPWRRGPGASLVRTRARRAALAAVGLVLVLTLNGLWNLSHTGFFVPVIFASRTITTATSTGWDGSVRAFRDPQTGADPSAWGVVRQAEARMRARREGRADPSPVVPAIDVAGAVAGAPAKLARLFADTETSFDYGYLGERSELSALALLPVSFGALLALGLVGAVLLVRREGWPSLVIHLPLVLGVVATTVLVHPSSRYRFPMVLPLLLLAGHAVAAVTALPAGRRRTLCAALLALVVAAFAVRTWTRGLQSPATWELRVAQSAAAAGYGGEVRRRVDRARRLGKGDPEVERRISAILRDGARTTPPGGPRDTGVDDR